MGTVKKKEQTKRDITPYIKAAEHKPPTGKFGSLDAKQRELKKLAEIHFKEV